MKLLFPVVLFYTTFGVDRSTIVISTLQKLIFKRHGSPKEDQEDR